MILAPRHPPGVKPRKRSVRSDAPDSWPVWTGVSRKAMSGGIVSFERLGGRENDRRLSYSSVR